MACSPISGGRSAATLRGVAAQAVFEQPHEGEPQGAATFAVHDSAGTTLDPLRRHLHAALDPPCGEPGRQGKHRPVVEEEREAVAVDEDRQETTGPAPLFEINDDISHVMSIAGAHVGSDFLAGGDVERRSTAPGDRRRLMWDGSGMSERPRIGGYDVLGRIARGSTADVFLATPHPGGDDTPAAVVLGLVGAGRRVALKRLYPHLAIDEDFVRMFVDEVQLMSRFRHEHIVQVHDLDEDKETCFAVLELVDGPSLSAALRVRARRFPGGVHTGLPAEVAVAVSAAVADALIAVHDLTDARTAEPLELVHRDVNPQNILVGRDGAVKLADFGVARSVIGRRSGTLTTKETTAGSRKGKASYLAPEQILGRHPLDPARPIDQRADLYALGATLWCLLTGAPPFVAESEVALFDTVLQAPTPRLRELEDNRLATDADLDALLQTLLARSPDDRPENAMTVRTALRDWLGARNIDPTAVVAAAVVDLGLPSLRTA